MNNKSLFLNNQSYFCSTVTYVTLHRQQISFIYMSDTSIQTEQTSQFLISFYFPLSRIQPSVVNITIMSDVQYFTDNNYDAELS